jgi:uncharacterized protein (DUF2345 family)
VQVTARDNIAAVAGKNVDISVAKRFTVAAGELVSMFAQKLGIKLFAVKGPVEIQAQNDAMSLAADKDVTISSINGVVHIVAKKELTLACGGAFIKLADGNIILGGPLDLFLKVITVQKQGKESMHIPVPDLPHSGIGPFSQKLVFTSVADGMRVSQVPYKLFTSADEATPARLVNQGSGAISGSMRAINPDNCDASMALFGEGDWGVFSDPDIDRESQLSGDNENGDTNHAAERT